MKKKETNHTSDLNSNLYRLDPFLQLTTNPTRISKNLYPFVLKSTYMPQVFRSKGRPEPGASMSQDFYFYTYTAAHNLNLKQSLMYP